MKTMKFIKGVKCDLSNWLISKRAKIKNIKIIRMNWKVRMKNQTIKKEIQRYRREVWNRMTLTSIIWIWNSKTVDRKEFQSKSSPKS